MDIRVKRAYEAHQKSDGTRVLVDRLWPRGVRKADARIDVWAKELAPSAALRAWFHKDPDSRYAEFVKRYKAELSKKKSLARETLPAKGPYTLVTAVKDPGHSHVPTLAAFLQKSKK
jgi:uncharacterized protein YeaO (DUF488 family)